MLGEWSTYYLSLLISLPIQAQVAGNMDLLIDQAVWSSLPQPLRAVLWLEFS